LIYFQPEGLIFLENNRKLMYHRIIK
jgi:hypothetical protein